MDMLTAVALYALMMVGIAWIEHDGLPRLHQSAFNRWMIEHVYEPFMRLAAIIAFVLAAYPGIFGLSGGPALATVLAVQPHWFSELMNLLLVVSVVLPLLPVIGRLPALVLPIQAIAVSTLLFHWTAIALGMEHYSLFPGWMSVAIMMLIAIFGLAAARPVSLYLVAKLHREDWKDACTDAVLMALQVPAIVIYTGALGRSAFGN